jgi:tRNA(Ile)-lysidine synthase
MRHRRKLSDFFIDLKLSIRMKNETPLVCRGKEIIWIAGQRLDDRYKITEKTKNVYKLQYNKETE